MEWWLNTIPGGTMFLLSDEPYILREQDDADQLRLEAMSDTACDVEIVTVHVLSDAELEAIRREAFWAAREQKDGSGYNPWDYNIAKYPTADDYINSLMGTIHP
jgi:hypothetical protein